MTMATLLKKTFNLGGSLTVSGIQSTIGVQSLYKGEHGGMRVDIVLCKPRLLFHFPTA